MKKKKSKKKTSFISKTANDGFERIILIILFFLHYVDGRENTGNGPRLSTMPVWYAEKRSGLSSWRMRENQQDTMIADINAYIDGSAERKQRAGSGAPG